MSIGWPQGIMLALLFLVLCVNASKNGQPRSGTHDLGAALLGTAIQIGLLYWGGFFA